MGLCTSVSGNLFSYHPVVLSFRRKFVHAKSINYDGNETGQHTSGHASLGIPTGGLQLGTPIGEAVDYLQRDLHLEPR